MKPLQPLAPYSPLAPDKIPAIVAGLTAGLSQGKVAEITGVSRVTVNKYANKPDIKAKIEAIQSRIVNEAYEDVASNLIDTVKAYKTIEGSDPETMQRRDHGFKATVKIAESMGILPSHSPSFLIQQVFSTTNNYLSLEADKLLDLAAIDIIPED